MSEKREREKKMGKTQKDSSCSSDLKVHRLRRGDFIPISLLFFFCHRVLPKKQNACIA